MKFFGEAEIANLGKGDRFAYEESLKVYRDNKNVMDTARDEGYDAGYQEAEEKLMQIFDSERRQKEDERRQKEELIKFLFNNGTPITQICQLVNLSEGEIKIIVQPST